MSEIYRFADLELDTSRFQIRRGGEVLPVQPQVFDVLRYLVSHHERIVTKDELLDKVWSGRFISEATLSSRIKAVRQLIGDSGKTQALVQTVRHRGFRYVGTVESELTEPRPITTPATAPAGEARAMGVAVVPFETAGEDAPDRGHVGEGIAADIISLLARHPWLNVISRGSSFAFRLGAATPQEIGRALGVRYLVSGRIRRAHGRMRIDVELADCATGRLLWSEAYDTDKTDFFAAQEVIAERVAAAIEPRLGQFERQRIATKRPDDLDAWECCHKAFWHLYRFTVEDLEAAKVWFHKALGFEGDLPRAHGGLAYASVQLAFYGAPSRRDAELQAALAESQRAVALDPWDAFNRFALGRTLCLQLRFPEAEAELQAAIETNQSFAQAYYALAFCYAVSDKPSASIPLYEKALRLSPQDPHLWTFHHMRGLTHFRLDEMTEAEHYVRAAVRQQNATYWPFATLCALLGDLGRTDEAAAIADRLLKMKPEYDLGFARDDLFFTSSEELVERFLAGLRKAGIGG